MENFNALTEMVRETKRLARFQHSELLQRLDNEMLATLIGRKLIATTDYTPLTSFCGSLGKATLGMYEKDLGDERSINKIFLQCGLNFFKVLEASGIVRHNYHIAEHKTDASGRSTATSKNSKSKMKSRQGQYVVMINDTEWIAQLTAELPLERIKHHKMPSMKKPRKRTEFYDYEGGALVSNIHKANIDEFEIKKVPNVYKQINKLNAIKYTINTEVLELAKQLEDHKLITHKCELVGEKERASMVRDTRMITMDASNMAEFDGFYLYWNYDTRGRVYCQSAYLSPQGNDFSKSLIKLNERKVIGSEGLYWMLVSTGNVLGHDKLEIDSRYTKAVEMLPELLKWASSPAEFVDQWSEYDEPWMLIAHALELKAIYDAPIPEEYASNFLTGWDATTSGSQIFAALVKDEITGKLTNLTDSDDIGDIYKHIADEVWKDLKPDSYWIQHYDIRRKLVKRSVMTYGYSCGKAKMGEHIYTDFKSKLPGITKDMANLLGNAIYFTCKRKLRISTVMDFFVKLGKDEYAKNKDLRLEGFVNGFPFIQSYRMPEYDVLPVILNDKRVRLRYIATYNDKVNYRNIITGSSPNIVHHLDSQMIAWMVERCDYPMIPIHDCAMSTLQDLGKLYEDFRNSFNELFVCNDMLQIICDDLGASNELEYGNLDVYVDNQYCFS